MDLLGHAALKYGGEDRVAPPTRGQWSAIATELRRHPAGELPPVTLEHMEIGVAMAAHPDAVVHRTGDNVRQRTPVRSGTVWLCPTGVHERDIRLVEWHEVLHIYLPPANFRRLEEFTGGRAVRPTSVRYLADHDDELIRAIARALHAETLRPTAGGAVLAETLALTLTARLAQSCCDGGAVAAPVPSKRLDERRLKRVLDYMEARLEEDITLTDLAAIACLSPFHFSRLFSARVGMPPHRYLSRLRLERAKRMLVEGQPIASVAFACRFAGQSSFTRAFRRATGLTPARFQTSSVLGNPSAGPAGGSRPIGR